jgi:DeoR/GlpR family transcriptional regulator of sugar metabolism
MQNRHNHILQRLAQEGQVKVTDLARYMGVSQVTVRKDLDFLESRKIIHRAHGYALLKERDGLSGRFASQYEEKERIARQAAQSACDLVLVESGTTCALAAYALLEQRNRTIITNSVFVADFCRDHMQGSLILLGGQFQPDAQVNVGHMVRQGLEPFHVQELYIGCEGFDMAFGFGGKDAARAQAVRDMADHAGRVIVLSASEKFGRQSSVRLLPLERVDEVITDGGISEDIREFLKEHHIQVTIV